MDRDTKIIIKRCDLCNNPIPCHNDIEVTINMLQEIDDSYESENDKHEPRLLLCEYCKNEYQIPGYPLT